MTAPWHRRNNFPFSLAYSLSLTEFVRSDEIRRRFCAYAFRRTADVFVSRRLLLLLPFSFVLSFRSIRFTIFHLSIVIFRMILSCGCAVYGCCVCRCSFVHRISSNEHPHTGDIYNSFDFAGMKRNPVVIGIQVTNK